LPLVEAEVWRHETAGLVPWRIANRTTATTLAATSTPARLAKQIFEAIAMWADTYRVQ
jgi:hypothetical protein